MLLEVRYLAIRVPVGVRVSQVFDERRVVDDRPTRLGLGLPDARRASGMRSDGLPGLKWLQSGRVQFRIHAVSLIAPLMARSAVGLPFDWPAGADRVRSPLW